MPRQPVGSGPERVGLGRFLLGAAGPDGDGGQRQTGAAAGQAVADLQAGKPVTLHQAMITMEEASVSFQLMAEVRNRLLESYQELMRMQV
jgi:flagellar hook-basal body complex protein FliE